MNIIRGLLVVGMAGILCVTPAFAAAPTPTKAVIEFYTAVINSAESQNLSSANKPHLSASLAEALDKCQAREMPYCLDFDPWGGAQVGIDKFYIVSGKVDGANAQVDVKVHRVDCDYAMVNVHLNQSEEGWQIVDFVIIQDDFDLVQTLRALDATYREDMATKKNK